MVPSGHLLCQKMKAQTKEYSNRTFEERNKLGPPYVYAYLGLLDGLVEDEAAEAEQKAVLEGHREAMKMLEATDVAQLIGHCKLSTAYKKEVMKLVLGGQQLDDRVQQALNKSLAKAGAERKTGPAPPSNLERTLVEWLGN